MGSLLEHAFARQGIGRTGRPVRSPSLLEGLSPQNVMRRRDTKDNVSSLSMVTLKCPLRTSLKLKHEGKHEDKAIVAGFGLCLASLGSRCQAEGEGQTQTIKNETIAANKAPLESKQMSPKLDSGSGGFPPKDGDGGGGGGGGGGWGQGGFIFWALVLLVGFLRDRELEKPYNLKPKKQKRRSMV